MQTIGLAGGPPTVPVNYIADFGGGGMMLAFGMLAALLAVQKGANGDIIDAAMVDGSAILSSMVWHMRARGEWEDEVGSKVLDGSAHFDGTFLCSDGRSISLGQSNRSFMTGV